MIEHNMHRSSGTKLGVHARHEDWQGGGFRSSSRLFALQPLLHSIGNDAQANTSRQNFVFRDLGYMKRKRSTLTL
jgi:hypothetical protein